MLETKRLHSVKPNHPFNNQSSESVAIGVKSQIPNMNAASRLNLRRDFKQQGGSALEHFSIRKMLCNYRKSLHSEQIHKKQSSENYLKWNVRREFIDSENTRTQQV